MDILTEAYRVVRGAEEELRRLIARAAEAQLYSEVSTVAQIAQHLAELQPKKPRPSDLRSEKAGTTSKSENPVQVPKKESADQQSASPRQRGSDKSYPRFERDGNRLVKIGWSKKNRSEYEHKAPIEVIEVFSRRLEQLVNDQGSTTFSMDDVLPLSTDGGEDLPDYQAYLALAWMRSLGAVAKAGRHSYRLEITNWLKDDMSQAWQMLASSSRTA